MTKINVTLTKSLVILMVISSLFLIELTIPYTNSELKAIIDQHHKIKSTIRLQKNVAITILHFPLAT